MRRATATILLALTTVVVAGCAPVVSEPARDEPFTEATATAVQVTPTSEPTVEPTPKVVADEFSQVVDGVLYQGTEIAPVRIGTDTPGEAPAVETQVTVENWDVLPVEANKYVVYVGKGTDGTWFWKVFGMSRHGSFRDLSNSLDMDRFPSRDAAAGGPFTVDGRVLDRAEFVLLTD